MTHLNNLFFDKGAYRAREGMSVIRPIELPKGMVIYRFYDSNRSRTPEEGVHGVWWMEFEYFQKIKHFADQHGYSRSYAARLFAAILYEWSEVNAYVACEVTAPLHAWKGRGKQVQSTGKDSRDLDRMTPMQGALEIYQLCVPGLDGAFSVAPRALQVTRSGAL